MIFNSSSFNPFWARTKVISKCPGPYWIFYFIIFIILTKNYLVQVFSTIYHHSSHARHVNQKYWFDIIGFIANFPRDIIKSRFHCGFNGSYFCVIVNRQRFHNVVYKWRLSGSAWPCKLYIERLRILYFDAVFRRDKLLYNISPEMIFLYGDLHIGYIPKRPAFFKKKL